MNLTYEIVDYEASLKSQVIELQSHLWSPSVALNTAYFEWKYERNPYIDVPLVYLAMHEGSVVGMRGFFGTQWEGGFPRQESTVLYADDLVIAPGHRNRGLMTRIMAAAFKDLAEKNYQYAFNLSAGQMTYLTSLVTGWRNVGSMQPMRRRPWRAALRNRRDNIFRRLPVPRLLDRISHQWHEKKRQFLAEADKKRASCLFRGNPKIRIETTPRCDAMAELVKRIGGGGFRHVRDSRYFGWRFQNPLSRYRFLFWEESCLEGYLVLQEYTSAYGDATVVNIVDWEATNVAVQTELLQAAIELTAHKALVIWSVSLPLQRKEILRKAGFEIETSTKGEARNSWHFLVRSIRDEELDGDWHLGNQQLTDMKNCDLRMIYSMLG